MNILAIPVPSHGEKFETLLKKEGITIEAIVSSEDPEPSLYDQDHDEAVLLVEGEAVLEMAGEKVVLKKGDFLYIKAHVPHKVLKTARGTRWFAVHLGQNRC